MEAKFTEDMIQMIEYKEEFSSALRKNQENAKLVITVYLETLKLYNEIKDLNWKPKS